MLRYLGAKLTYGRVPLYASGEDENAKRFRCGRPRALSLALLRSVRPLRATRRRLRGCAVLWRAQRSA